jgi:hypothetical protein
MGTESLFLTGLYRNWWLVAWLAEGRVSTLGRDVALTGHPETKVEM